jgi:hypothetical protein
MIAFAPPDRPADPDLFNAATNAAIDRDLGLISDDHRDAIIGAYLYAEREQLEQAWRRSQD